jgi:hypothetical protein
MFDTVSSGSAIDAIRDILNGSDQMTHHVPGARQLPKATAPKATLNPKEHKEETT